MDDLTVDDFFAGLLAALVEKGIGVLSTRGEPFYRAVEASYRELEAVAHTRRLDPRFVILVDPIHGDSPVVREAVYGATLRHLASLDAPEFSDLRIKLDHAQAQTLLRHLPGGPGVYEEIAEIFLSSYPFVTA